MEKGQVSEKRALGPLRGYRRLGDPFGDVGHRQFPTEQQARAR
jgi:hypothetical protein